MSKVGNKTNQQLEDETDELKHKTVSTDLKKALMQGRMAKKLNQKELAQKIGTDAKTIQEYESGKAIPNNALIAKMEKELGCKLPRAPKK